MKLCGVVLLGLMVVVSTGCGTVPASLLIGEGTGSLDVMLDGEVNSDINLDVVTNVSADVTCTIECNLNTGECETVCELDAGLPPTPEELGEELYLANCSGCHGTPGAGGGPVGPDLAGKSADRILQEFNSGHHPGGEFPNLIQEDIDNLAAYLASV